MASPARVSRVTTFSGSIGSGVLDLPRLVSSEDLAVHVTLVTDSDEDGEADLAQYNKSSFYFLWRRHSYAYD